MGKRYTKVYPPGGALSSTHSSLSMSTRHYNETNVGQIGLKDSLKDKDGNCVDLNLKIIYKLVAQNMVCGRYVVAVNIFDEI
jgi:hypothetical protein